MGIINRFEVYLVSLDPTKGSEIKKTRPCVVILLKEEGAIISVLQEMFAY